MRKARSVEESEKKPGDSQDLRNCTVKKTLLGGKSPRAATIGGVNRRTQTLEKRGAKKH